MKKQTKFSIKNRIKSFGYALNGIRTLFQTEHNAWIHLLSAFLVIGFGFYFDINPVEWCLIFFSIGLVFITEIINTSIEYLTDLVTPDYNEKAKKVKDLAAASVFVSACIAFCIGCLIFLPKIYLYFGTT